MDINGIGSEDGVVTIGDELVENGVSRFEVMITDDGDVVADEIAEVCNTVTFALTDEIEIIRSGFSLQYITTVNQNRTARPALAFLGDIGVDSLQTAFAPAGMSEIEWEIVAMNVTCKNDSNFPFLFFH